MVVLMPRYFLHVNERSALLVDPDGQECADLAAARQEATEAARDLMAERLRAGEPLGLHREMIIADEHGTTFATLSFHEVVPDDNAE